MGKRKVVVTGAAGTLGRVLMEGLDRSKFEIVGIDREPIAGGVIIQTDLAARGIPRTWPELTEVIKGADTIVHLAWDIREGGGKLSPIIPNNKVIAERILDLAQRLKVRLVILASSVHVNLGRFDYQPRVVTRDHQTLHQYKVTERDVYRPSGAYGASKVYIEMLGQVYADRGLDVVAARFGNITANDEPGEPPLWLSHRDLIQFVTKCCGSNLRGFHPLFALSGNDCNPFDLSLAKAVIGYQPQDGQTCPQGL